MTDVSAQLAEARERLRGHEDAVVILGDSDEEVGSNVRTILAALDEATARAERSEARYLDAVAMCAMQNHDALLAENARLRRVVEAARRCNDAETGTRGGSCDVVADALAALDAKEGPR